MRNAYHVLANHQLQETAKSLGVFKLWTIRKMYLENLLEFALIVRKPDFIEQAVVTLVRRI